MTSTSNKEKGKCKRLRRMNLPNQNKHEEVRQMKIRILVLKKKTRCGRALPSLNQLSWLTAVNLSQESYIETFTREFESNCFSNLVWIGVLIFKLDMFLQLSIQWS